MVPRNRSAVKKETNHKREGECVGVYSFHGRSRMAIADPRVTTMPGRSTSRSFIDRAETPRTNRRSAVGRVGESREG